MDGQVDLGRMISIITTSIPWIVNIYVVQLLLMYTFAVLGMYVKVAVRKDGGSHSHS